MLWDRPVQTLFIVYLKFSLTRYSVFLFAEVGSPPLGWTGLQGLMVVQIQVRKWPVQGTVVILELGKAPAQNKCKSLLPHVETLGAGPGGACLAAPGSLSSLSRSLQGSQQMAGSFPWLPRYQKLCVFCLITLTNIHFLYLL